MAQTARRGPWWNPKAGVDTVEFDLDGCAMSRTMMPLGSWSPLLKIAAGAPA